MNGRSSLGMWGQLKEAAIPVAAYWVLLVFSYACFLFAVVVSQMTGGGSLGSDDVVALTLIAAVCFGGAAIGQAMAFLRVRTWIVVVFGAICWALAFGTALATAAAGSVAALVALVFFLLPFALTGGLWSLETHRGLWATWLPFLLSVGATITWIEKVTDRDANWHAGEKWAIWDLATLLFLGGSVLLTLLYLVTRETHRLALWRRGPTAPLAPSLKEQGAARPRLTLFGCGALLILAAGLTLATAIIAPYFWRTGPGDEPDDGPASGQEPTEPAPAPSEGDGEFMKRLMEGVQRIAEAAQQAGQKAGSAVCTMLTVFLLGLLGLVIAWRPLRRLTLVRHLKDPLWPVPATDRIEQGWRLVEIALGDVGTHPHPGEDARGLAKRARPVLEKLSLVEVHGLEDAAEVADRVRFGLGVHATDLEVMQRFSAWALDTVWERLDDLQQLRCMYRRL